MNQTAPVAVTGAGVITPLGDSVTSLMDALAAGQTSITALPGTTLPDSEDVAGSRLLAFDATKYANVRGMRIYNRATRLGICATRLALQDARLENVGYPSERLGVVMAGTFAHFDTLIEYDRSLVTQGPSRTNPALMPLAIPSAPGAIIALSFGAKACSITLANGGTGGLDALGLAARLVRAGRVGACVVVSALAFFDEMILSAARAGILTTPDAFRIFDRHGHGSAFGEAGAALVVESASDARARGVAAKALVLAQASAFADGDRDRHRALAHAARKALELGKTGAGEIGLCSSGANGSEGIDDAEGRALLQVLDGSAEGTAVTAIKSSLGDSMDTAGLLQTIVAMTVLSGKPAPPIVALEKPRVPGLGYVRAATPIGDGRALVTATSRAGGCSALVLARGSDA